MEPCTSYLYCFMLLGMCCGVWLGISFSQFFQPHPRGSEMHGVEALQPRALGPCEVLVILHLFTQRGALLTMKLGSWVVRTAPRGGSQAGVRSDDVTSVAVGPLLLRARSSEPLHAGDQPFYRGAHTSYGLRRADK